MAHPSRFSASRRYSPRSRLLAAAVAGCFVSAPAFTQLPTNPTVVSGSATFSQTANVLTVTNSNGTIINWDTFSIGAGKTTYFQQTSASSAVLNRVVTADPSQIYGTLASNGKVWLVNPAGIMVGAGGVVDTAGFVGSTLRVGDADFLAGRLNFQATPGAGSFVNQGTITAPSGGSVYLIGSAVSNEGIIATPGGETILAAGETVNLIDTATPGVKVEVTGAAGDVTNLGTVLADAGRIGMAGVIVRNSGTLNASSVVNEGGRIFLKASRDAYVDGAGRIVATGTKGGRVEVLGDTVTIKDQAEIDVSGVTGGGTLLVGGDYQGRNPEIQNARTTYVGRNTRLKADAQQAGNGGKVIVWSDDTTTVLGTISARGGDEGGDGGFVETSGYRRLAFDARVDTRAPQGKVGNLLLDPSEFCIDNDGTTCSGSYAGYNYLSQASLNGNLTSNHVTLQTDGTGSYGGDVVIKNASGITGNSAYGLSILAYGGAGGTGNITIENSNLNSLTNLTLVAGWDGVASPNESNVLAGKGNVNVSQSTLSAGTIQIYGGGDLSFGSTTADSGTSVTSTGTMSIVGRNIIARGRNKADAYGGASGYGAGVLIKSGGAQYVKADTSSGYIALYGGEVSNSGYGGQLVYGGSVVFQSSGSQTVVAKGVYLKAGASGHDNAAVLEAYGSQAVTVYAGGIGIYGGGTTGSYNNFAGIQQNNSSAGSQTIGVYGGGSIYMAGGAGTGTGGYYDTSCGSACSSVSSHNKASIRNAFGDQTIDFYGGGNLTLVGGSGGNGNEAMINNETTGTQKIWSSQGAALNDSTLLPVISITGGSSGGTMVYGADLKYHHVDNSAGISAGSDTAGTGTQEIRAKGITLTASGNSSTYGGAYLGAYGSAIIISYGDVTMTGGGGTRNANETFTTGAGIGNDKNANVALSIYGGNLNMTGGTGTGGGAMIGSLQYGATVGISVYGGDITMTGNKGAVMIGSASQTATATATKINIRAAGNITMTASSDTTGYGDVWVGSYGGALGTAAGEYNISSGKNLKTSGGGKKVYLGSNGTGPAEITLKSGYDILGTTSSDGGNLDIGSGTVVKGPANSTAVSIQTYGGSIYGGTAAIGGVIEANSGSVLVSAYSDISVSGTIHGGTGVDLRAGAMTGGASPTGGNIQLASTSRIDGYGGGGVVIGAIAKGTSTGKVTQ
ncbi:partial Heme/hemopexin-binding protein, partial [Rhodocyclaceae bacterium]